MKVPRAEAALLAVAVALAASACRRPSSGCAAGERLALVAPLAPVGFDAPFSVAARPLCAEARAGTISWRQLAGPPVSELAPADAGFALRARTPTLAASVGAPLPWGVVPLSPRTRGELVLEATWRDGSGAEERHEVHVAAAARARGLPNTPLGARVYLGGAGWHVEAHPPASAAKIETTMTSTSGGVASFLPDVPGDFRIVDGAGRGLTLRAARYDETPLDCGRAECHAAITTASAGSPMTTVLARGLPPAPDGHGAMFGPGYPGCALACHATGEPSDLRDGGFVDVLGESSASRRARAALVGGACRGRCAGSAASAASRVTDRARCPRASARWGVLRADVCATCHDAPARYGHVAAWRTTAMARADRDARAGADRACARCHTTWGFLANASAEAARIDRRPPVEVGPVGVTCAACHAVHDHVIGRAPATSRSCVTWRGPRSSRAPSCPRPRRRRRSVSPATRPTPPTARPRPRRRRCGSAAAGSIPRRARRSSVRPRTRRSRAAASAATNPAPSTSSAAAATGFVAGRAACARCHAEALPRR